MKKLLLVSSIIMLLVLMFSFTQSFILTAAAQSDDPGAKATEKAVEKTAEAAGEGEKEKQGPKQNFKGTIDSINTENLVVKLADGTLTQPVLIDAKTKIKIPGMGKSAALADLKAGMGVAVQAMTDKDGNLVARQIHLVPGKPTKLHRVGTVSNYNAGASLTVTDVDGQSTTFIINADTKILPKDRQNLLKDGAFVTVICPRSFASGDPVAKGIVVHPEGSGPGQPDESEDSTSG